MGDGVYAGTSTAGIMNSALGSLRAEVAERGTQITQPLCTSSYVAWRFCTTQSVQKIIMLVPTHSEALPRALYRHLF
jgi:hypothetical protein